MSSDIKGEYFELSPNDVSRLMRSFTIADNNCWMWDKRPTDKGYGQFTVSKPIRKVLRAHRAVWFASRGAIPTWSLDHLCRNRVCVNPDHLEPVSNKENVLRGAGITAVNAKKTHCKRGHPLSEDNIYRKPVPRGVYSPRQCRTCKLKQSRDYRERQKVLALLNQLGEEPQSNKEKSE